jgi:TP901 family phage tail tape measure protein
MPEELSKGMYLIESAGYHGAQGLSVLKAAAEGAKVGGADMATVANGLTTALTDYNIPASRANAVTSALVQTVADGKMKMQDLSSSLGMVMPKAAAVGVSFQDVNGALATMTASGMTARRASMNLANTIMSLAAPGAKASDALTSVGLTAQQVKDALSQKGLAGTLEMVTDAVGNKFPKGSVAGVNALKDILGGTTGYGTALALTGTHMAAFTANVKNIGGALNGQNKSVQGFGLTQKDLAFQTAQAKAALETLGIRIGNLLIPVVQKIIPMLSSMVLWLMQHKTIAIILGGIIGGLLVAATGAWAVSLFLAGGALNFLLSPVTLIIAGIALLVVGLIYAYNHFQTFHDIVNAVFNGVKAVAGVVVDWFTQTAMPALTTAWDAVWGFLQDAWNNVGKPIFDVIVVLVQAWWAGVQIIWGYLRDAWNVIWAVVSTTWNDIGKPVFDAIGTIAGLMWDALKVVFDLVSGAWDLVWFLVTTAWNTVGKPLFDLVVVAVQFWWGTVKMVFGFLADAWGVLWGGITTAWNDVGKPVFDFIGGVISGLWNNILKPTFALIVGAFLSLVGSLVQGAADAFGWVPGLGPKLQQAAADFDTFKTNTMNAINGISGKTVTIGVNFGTGTPGIAGAHALSGSSVVPGIGTALGGVITGGIRGRDSVLRMLEPGEFVVRANGTNLSDAVAHFGGMAAGGLVVNTSIPTAADVSNAVNSGFSSFAGGLDFSGMMTAAFGSSGGEGGAGVQRWLSMVLQALAIVGQPASLAQTTLRRMNQESGGNPMAINLTDSNAARGDPSRGLMQTIMSTFMAYRMPGLSANIYDPLSNTVASMRYAIADYGSLTAAYNRAGGYANGTTAASAGPGWVGENGPELLDFHGGETVTPVNMGINYDKLASAVVSALHGTTVTLDNRVVGAIANQNGRDLFRNGVSRIKP